MVMKNIIKTLLAALIPLTAFAQNQGDDLGLGQGATAIVGRTNEARASTAGTSGKANYIGLTAKGDVYTVSIDNATGLAQSNIPISNTLGMGGPASLNIGSYPVTADLVEAASTTTVINATSHLALVNDNLYFYDGTNARSWAPVCGVSANSITLCSALRATPSVGNGFEIYRPVPLTALIGSSGRPVTSVGLAPDVNTGATSIMKLEDVQSASGDAGVAAFGVFQGNSPATYGGSADYSPFTVNDYGAVYVDIHANYRNNAGNSILKIEDVGHTTGDAGVQILGVANDSRTARAADGDYIPIATNTYGAALVNLDATTVISAGNQPVRLEDAAFAASDAVMMVGYVNNEGAGISFNTTSGDVVPPTANRYGAQYVIQSSALMGSSDIAASFMKAEDATASSGEWGAHILGKRLDVLATGETGSNNEYSTPIVDTLARLYVNPWGAAVTEFWQSCSASNTGTSDTAIKAAVASNRIYTTNISCFNTAAVASSFEIKDGSTVIYAGGISNSTLAGVAYWEHTFNTPLRGTVNTALNFDMATTATATTCCATGFISPY